MTLSIHRREFVSGIAAAVTGLASGGLTTVVAEYATPMATPGGEWPLSISAGPGEDEFTVAHAQGESIVPANPAKIVSYDLATIDTLETLGVMLAGVPDVEAEGLINSADAEVVGSLFEPDYEALNALEPDLILAGGRSAAVVPELAKIAPTIDVTFDSSQFMNSLTSVTNTLATLIGKESEAETALAEYTPRLDALKEAAASAENCLVTLVTGGAVTALSPANERGGRGALIYQELGVPCAVEDLETATHGEPVSFEFLLEHDPQWLFVIDRDAATGEDGAKAAEEVLDNEIVRETRAFKDNKIMYLNPQDWYSITGAGLTSMGRMLIELEGAFGIV